jgi:hypothetical protein
LRQHEQQVAYLQGELRVQQEAGNKKQHELIHAHQECSAWRTNWRIQHQLASGKGRESVAQEGAG